MHWQEIKLDSGVNSAAGEYGMDGGVAHMRGGAIASSLLVWPRSSTPGVEASWLSVTRTILYMYPLVNGAWAFLCRFS